LTTVEQIKGLADSSNLQSIDEDLIELVTVEDNGNSDQLSEDN